MINIFKMKLLNFIFLLLIFFILSSCAGPVVNRLKSMEKKGTEFNITLSNEYQKIAEFEMDKMFDEIDARHFALKGIKSAEGNIVYPENPENWNIPKDKIDELKNAYKDLLETIKKSKDNQKSKDLAEAQANFDCWVEQQEENWQWNHIDQCKEAFQKKLSLHKAELFIKNIELDESISSEPKTNTNNDKTKTEVDLIKNFDPKIVTAQEAEESLTKKTKNIYIQPLKVYFNFDSFKLTSLEVKKINDFINKNTNKLSLKYLLEGHTDSSGKANYNLKLSKQRAEVVKNYLINQGVNKNNINSIGFGESKQYIKTNDGVREKRNRRVEIIIK